MKCTKIINLKTHGISNPLGIEEDPVFSWQMESADRGILQTAYRLVVKDVKGAVVMDSGWVEDGRSTEIPYTGSELRPEEVYCWNVTVKDNLGNLLESEEAIFEMGMRKGGLENWNGAHFIGAGEIALDAAATPYFRIATEVEFLTEGGTASILFGADDFRMNNRELNLFDMEGENYYRLELVRPDSTRNQKAAIRVFRVGFFPGDGAEEPYTVVSADTMPTNLEKLLSEDKSQYELEVEGYCGELRIWIDKVQVETSTENKLIVDNFGSGGDYLSFPNLNSIGFAMRAGEAARFRGFCLKNTGYGEGLLFSHDVGAGYQIFETLPGVTIEDNEILVEGGADGVLGYADPSYGSLPMLRTEFELAKKIAKARLYVTAHGLYEFYINGIRIGEEDWFTPGSDEYAEELPYQIYDVTDNLKQGRNAAGAYIGEGWWCGYMSYATVNKDYYGNAPALLARLIVQYEDGTEEIIVTSPDTWKCCMNGPVISASFFMGCRYNALMEKSGWAESGYDDSDWKPAVLETIRKPFEAAKLVLRYDQAVQKIGELQAVSCRKTREIGKAWIYDFEENTVGVPQITIPASIAEAGKTIIIRIAEMLYPELEEYIHSGIQNTMMIENYRAALNTYFYTMKEGENVFAPKFNYSGYRYLEIVGMEEALPLSCVKSLIISSCVPSSTYVSRNELVNRLYKNVLNSQIANYLSLPTDCPQRNERMGWLGDAQVFSRAASYNADIYNFMRQWMKVLRAEQGEDGSLPVYAPSYGAVINGTITKGERASGFWSGITWHAAVAVIPWQMYLQYGKKAILKENLDAMLHYLEWSSSRPMVYCDRNGVEQIEMALTGNSGFLGEWLALANTDDSLIGNAVYVYLLTIVSRMAEIVGRNDTARELAARACEAKKAWNRLYLDSKTGKTCTPAGVLQDTQGSYATPIALGVVEEHNLKAVMEQFAETVTGKPGTAGNGIRPYTITTGFSATPNILLALSENGRNDLAHRMFVSKEYASWLYPVTQGATSVWERWNGYTLDGGFNGNNSMNSFDHYALGAVVQWMYEYQLGIETVEEEPGYKQFILAPMMEESLSAADGSFESPYGTIRSGYELREDGYTYWCEVPANTTAKLYLPFAEKIQPEDTKKVLGAARGVIRNEERLCLTLGSGKYKFLCEEHTLKLEVVS